MSQPHIKPILSCNPIVIFRILSGCVRMPDMSVRSIEDTSLKISDLEIENASKEINFNIEGEFKCIKRRFQIFKLNKFLFESNFQQLKQLYST